MRGGYRCEVANVDRPEKLLVLVFATDLLLRSRVEEGLKATGCRAVAAAGPTRLRERLDQERPSAAFVDLEARGGADAVADLAALGVPVVGFCGHTERDLRSRGLELGCSRVITRGEVAAKLDRVLEMLLSEPSLNKLQ